MNPNLTKRGFIRILSYFTALCVFLGVGALINYQAAQRYRQSSEYGYQRALSDLSDSVSNLEVALEKGVYANTAPQQQGIAAKLLKDRGYSSFRILVAGTGAFEEEVTRAVTEMGVEDVVQMLGFRSDAAALLNILDVQLNASYGTEATSMALLEGMSLGLPTIASDYGGNPFVITSGQNGLLFPSKDSAALADAMAELMDHPEEVAIMREKALETYQSRFTGEVFARNTEQIYENVLKGASK